MFVWVASKAQGLNDWQTITYMNNITDMVYSDDEIWVSTTGGVYKFMPEDSTYQSFTNIEGLGSVDLTSIDTDRYGGVLASSRGGQINRYNRDSGLWKVYSNLEGEVIVDLFTNEDTLWVATNTGVGVFLISEDHLEFRDFYSNMPILISIAYRVTVYNNRIYFATEDGLLNAPSDFIKNNLKISEAWTLLTTDEGLPSNSVHDIVPTADSLLVATIEGAVSIKQQNLISEISSWTHGRVSIIRVSGSDIYFLRYGDYYKQSGNSWELLGREVRRITAGVVDNKSNLWIGMDKAGIKHSTWDHSFLIDGPASNHVGNVIKDRSGDLWMTSGKYKLYNSLGFYRYDFTRWTNYRFFDFDWSRKNHTVYVYEGIDGNIFIGSWGGGMTIIDQDEIDYYHAWPEDGRFNVRTVDSDEDHILAGLPPERRSCLAPFLDGADYYTVIPYILEDDFGNIWCINHGAEDAKYLAVLPRDENGNLETECAEWYYFGRNIGFSNEEGEASVLEFDDFNRLWIGTGSSGILVFDYNGTVNNRNDDQSLIRVNTSNASIFTNQILALKRDLDGIMWIGTSGGLSSFDGQNFFKHVGEIGPIENKINSIFVDSFNNKWFATDGGLSILKADESPWESKAWVHYTPENSGLPDKFVNSIFVDQNKGEAYIGTESGLSIFRGSFSELKKEMTSVISGPSPFVLDDNKDFVIKNLVYGATVKILNVNGRLVRLLSSENGNVEGGRATWDGRDQSNAKVSSGVYIYLIYNEEGITASGKIAVINP